MDKKEKRHTLLLTVAALIATLVVVAAVVTAWHQSDDPANQPKHQISAVKHHADTVRDTMRRALKPQLLKPIPKPSTMIQGTLRRTDGTPVWATMPCAAGPPHTSSTTPSPTGPRCPRTATRTTRPASISASRPLTLSMTSG